MAHPTPRKNLDGNVVSLEKYLAAVEFDDDVDEDDYDHDAAQSEHDALAEDSWEASRESDKE